MVIKRLSDEDIAKYFREIHEKAKMNPPIVQKPDQNMKRRDDGVFKPPVPVPVKEFEIQSMDYDSKYCLFCFLLW